jgi:hypothetical protein
MRRHGARGHKQSQPEADTAPAVVLGLGVLMLLAITLGVASTILTEEVPHPKAWQATLRRGYRSRVRGLARAN